MKRKKKRMLGKSQISLLESNNIRGGGNGEREDETVEFLNKSAARIENVMHKAEINA